MRKSAETARGMPAGRSLRYLPQLDGLRAIAVLAVLAVHAHIPFVAGGYLGVDVFFVLSGFLITSILVSELQKTGKIRMRRFYMNRVLRLAPALVVVCAVVALLWALIPWAPLRTQTLWGVPAALTYTSNWVRAFEVNSLAYMGHTWSLAVEEHFYLVWPLLLIIVARITGRVRVPVIALCCLAILYRIASGTIFDGTLARLYNGTDMQSTQILIGCALAVTIQSTAWAGNYGAAAISIAVIGSAFIAFTQESSAYRTGGAVAVALATSVLIAHVINRDRGWVARLLAGAGLVWIGKRSYGIYLWHYPIFGLFSASGLPTPVAIGASTVLSFAIPALSYRYIETRFLAMKQRDTLPSTEGLDGGTRSVNPRRAV